jgi:hypothetical protein
MRALVSLYHQCETFITPENLDDRIDYAFIRASGSLAVPDKPDHFTSYVELENAENMREKIPRISEYSPPSDSRSYTRGRSDDYWSDFQNPREREVVEALYGSVDQTKPGWDILEESAERIEEEIMEDRKNAYAAVICCDIIINTHYRLQKPTH